MSRKFVAVLLVFIIILAQPLAVSAGLVGGSTTVNEPVDAPRAVQYVNFTDDTSSWQSRFYPLTWPTGPFRQVTLTYTLYNHGDQWDRASTVGVNNVTLIQMTTKEYVGGTQEYSKDITIFQELFSQQPSELEWDGPPNYNGGWGAKLSFAFYPGTPPIEVPKVLPAIFNRYVDRSMKNMTNATVKFPSGTQRASAVITEEGNSASEEFWFGNSPIRVRDFQLMVNTTTVLDITAQPYVNSGGALGGTVGNLYEWNATPPPGDGLRPLHFVNITPYAYLLNGTKNVTLVINEGQDYWMVGLSFLLYGPAPGAPYKYQNRVIQRTQPSSVKLTIFTSAWSTRPVTNGQETLYVNYSSWMNSTSPVEVHEVMTVSRFIAASPIYIVMENVEETVFDFKIDTASGNAVDLHYIRTWRNTTRVWGNGQNSSRMDLYQDYEFINGSNGGSRVSATHMSTLQYVGNISHMAVQWNVTDIKFQNVTGSNGIATKDPTASQHFLSGTPTPFPALFFISPAPEKAVTGTVDIEFAYTNASLVSSTLDINGNPTDVTGKSGQSWDTSPLMNGVYTLKTTGTDNKGTQHINIIRVFKGQRPVVVSTDPADGTSLVPVDNGVSVKFSMPMDKSISQKAFAIEPSVNGSSFSWNAAEDTLSWGHSEPFKNSTWYNITVHGNATNAYGVDMEKDFAFSFRTWRPPFVKSVQPRPGAVNVTLNSTVRVTFSVPMNKTSVEVAFSMDPSVGNGSFSWDGTGKNITWSHKDPFARNQTYKVTVGASAKASDGAPMDRAYSFNISTVNPPRVIAVSPPDNSTRVRLDAFIIINFSVPMYPDITDVIGYSIEPSVYGEWQYTPGDSSFQWWHLTENFAPNTTYKFTLAAGVKDFGNIPMAEPYVWSFRTAPRPVVIATSPRDNETLVDLSAPIIITFSEPMEAGSEQWAFSIEHNVRGSFTWTTAEQFSWTHDYERFKPNSEYMVTLDMGSALGVGLEVPFTFKFTTAPNPKVAATYPKDGDKDVPLDTDIVVTFDLPMNRSNVKSALSIDPAVTFNRTWENDSAIKLHPQEPLQPSKRYTVTVRAAVTSMLNSTLGRDVAFTFTTGKAPDTVRPEIKSFMPANGTLRVPVAATIVVTFSEPMNRTSVEKAMKVTSGGKDVPGTFKWNPAGDVLTFTPSAALESGTKVEVVIGTSASDLAGNTLSSDGHCSFETVPKEKKVSGPSPMLMAGVAAGIIAAVVLAILLLVRRGKKEGVPVQMAQTPPKDGKPAEGPKENK